MTTRPSTTVGPGQMPLVPADVLEIARAVRDAGGRLVIIGGWVRDALRGQPSKDLDLEVYGVTVEALGELLRPLGFTDPVGRQFPVFRQTRTGLDLALPRAPGADHWDGSPEHFSALAEEAARARDLTLNAIAWDPLDDAFFDPLSGRADLERSILRAADVRTFAEDPLRVMRVARLAASLEAEVEPELTELCRGLDLAGVAQERIAGELLRMLERPREPWRAIEALDELGHLNVLAPIAALKGVPQDPTWHPEGDVFVHTGMVVDRAAELASELDREAALQLMLGALCHDVGKPETTEEVDGRVRSLGHEAAGAQVTKSWLSELSLGEKRVRAVEALVRHHLAPAIYVSQGAKKKAYRRLARKLDAAGIHAVALERVARADHLGRTTPDALAGRFDAGTEFLAAAEAAGVIEGVPNDVVSARRLMALGVEAGPELGRLLERCREVQDETGEQDPDVIATRVLR